ncbi:regulator of nonsense transcripts 2-like [Bacillus rossius redtenbacheri]|uniref:regulator of nonsense transcripts 2-like n=1 Tax=Bacillus rossius redtenbacheri TaxID=93214 RepID=UPI002FDED7FA
MEDITTENSSEIDTWQYLCDQIAEIQFRLSRINALREVNLNVASFRQDETYFLSLDSSLKKNSAFVRKLKSFSAKNLDCLVQEMKTLNLTKYLGEVAGALVESKLKMGDIPSASQFFSVMHQFYGEFSAILLETWTRIFDVDPSMWHQNESKMRINLLFYADILITGVCNNEESYDLFERVFSTLINSDMEEHRNVNVIKSFCKYCGNEFAGLIPRSVLHIATIYNKTIPTSNIIHQDKQRYFRALLKEYHVTLCKHLLRIHRELLRAVREEKRVYRLKGEVNDEKKNEAKEMLLNFQDVHKNCMELGEYLSEDTPLFLQDELSWVEEIRLEDEEEFSSELWEDEETQHFYEHFPNLKDIVATFPLHSSKFQVEHPMKINQLELVGLEKGESPRILNNKVQFKVFLENLPKCVNRELIDNSSVNFAMTYNTKLNRKQLVQTLFSAPRTRVDLLPFYARLVATLSPTMPDIAKELETCLLKEFKFLCRNKCQTNIESKLKVVKFMGELVKFRVFPATEALDCLKWLLFNFSHPHHIEMFCSLMDACGRFLFRQQNYHQRVKIYLEDMMRQKAACPFDPRFTTMMENTYYQVNPPERATTTNKCRPIMHEFIRKLLYKDLARNSSESVLKSMRKLDWKNREIAAYAVKCLTNATNVKFHNIRCLAEVVCGLAYYQELVGIKVVDAVLEDIQVGMELNLPEHNQHRLTMVKYLGELHNYYMLESDEVLNVLHSFVTFGWPMDPPTGLFRIRLACMLLNTAGPYMGTAVPLENYLTTLRDFYWSSAAAADSWGAAVANLLDDTLLELRPDLRLRHSDEDPPLEPQTNSVPESGCNTGHNGVTTTSESVSEDQSRKDCGAGDPNMNKDKEDGDSTIGNLPKDEPLQKLDTKIQDEVLTQGNRLVEAMDINGKMHGDISTNRKRQTYQRFPTNRTSHVCVNFPINKTILAEKLKDENHLAEKACLMDTNRKIHEDSSTDEKSQLYQKLPTNRNGQTQGNFKVGNRGQMHTKFPLNRNGKFYEDRPALWNGHKFRRVPPDRKSQIKIKCFTNTNYSHRGKGLVYAKNDLHKELGSSSASGIKANHSTCLKADDISRGYAELLENTKEMKTKARKSMFAALDDLQSHLEILE